MVVLLEHVWSAGSPKHPGNVEECRILKKVLCWWESNLFWYLHNLQFSQSLISLRLFEPCQSWQWGTFSESSPHLKINGVEEDCHPTIYEIGALQHARIKKLFRLCCSDVCCKLFFMHYIFRCSLPSLNVCVVLRLSSSYGFVKFFSQPVLIKWLYGLLEQCFFM